MSKEVIISILYINSYNNLFLYCKGFNRIIYIVNLTFDDCFIKIRYVTHYVASYVARTCMVTTKLNNSFLFIFLENHTGKRM